jgi:monoamine oxidase
VKLLVVGAGLSGLVAAAEVQRAGHEVVVLEARDRVGGRVFTRRDGLRYGQYADVGAEIIYRDQPHIVALCARYALELTRSFSLGAETPDLVFGGQRLTRSASAEIVAELRAAIARTRPASYETVAQWRRRARVSDPAGLLLTAIAQGTPAASLRLADARELNLELSWGEGYRKIRGGNDLLPKALASDLDVRLNQVAHVVGWRSDGVTVETDVATFAADRVLVTIPGPLTTDLGFDPPLPPEKVRAHLQLRYGTGLRIVVQYAERDLVRSGIGLGCFTDRAPGYIMEQTMEQPGDGIVVSGLAAGDVEPGLESEVAVLDEVDATLSKVVGQPLRRVGGFVKSWTRDPLSRAVVRAPIGDQRQTVLPAIAAPLGGRLFFAGEHTDDRVGPGGMEGAIRSAYRVVKEILAEG